MVLGMLKKLQKKILMFRKRIIWLDASAENIKSILYCSNNIKIEVDFSRKLVKLKKSTSKLVSKNWFL